MHAQGDLLAIKAVRANTEGARLRDEMGHHVAEQGWEWRDMPPHLLPEQSTVPNQMQLWPPEDPTGPPPYHRAENFSEIPAPGGLGDSQAGSLDLF